MKEITIDGVVYIPKEEAPTIKSNTEGMIYCVIRTYSAGVHAGFVKARTGQEVVLYGARRLWKWAGAFTLSEIALKGVSKPDECKFSVTIPEITLTEAVEIIPCTNEAYRSITGVKDYEP